VDKDKKQKRIRSSNQYRILKMNWNLHRAMLNSYFVIIRDYDPYLLMKNNSGFFAHDPTSSLNKEDVEGVLSYFEEEEDYVKCKEINNFIKTKWSLENIKKK
tara:strand:- start:9802 stop:10107 length:306 start_codon:yes stop_codon:yes gene_type:complete